MTPEIIKMTEGEARLRTISERLYSHSDRRLATALDSISDQIAENFWKAEDKATEQSSIAMCENLLRNHEIAPASAIGHLIGYNQY